MAVLAVIALGVTAEGRSGLATARNLADAAQAEAAAEGGVWRAVGVLLTDQQGQAWRPDGSSRTFAVGTASVDVAVQDEGGKIDLGTADPQMIDNLLHVVGVSDAAAETVMDRLVAWRAAEAASGSGAAADALAPNADVAIADGPVLQRLKPFITDYSGHAGIDPATAPAEVLLAIPGVEPGDVSAYLRVRGQVPAGAGPLQDFPTLAAAMRYFLWSAGTVVTVTATARTQGAVFTRAAVIDLSPRDRGADRPPDRPYDILAWEGPS